MNKQFFAIMSPTLLCVLLSSCGNKKIKKIEEKKQVDVVKVAQAEEITEIIVHFDQEDVKAE
jgi:hypothetical protein